MITPILLLLRDTYRRWVANNAPKMGAALSFYTVFSLAPLIILVLSLVSLAVERNAARAEIVEQFRLFVGAKGAEAVEMILANAAIKNTGWLGTLIGSGVLVVGATAVFGDLQESLNQIWGVTNRQHPVLALLKTRILSFAMILVLGFLMLISFLLSAGVAAADKYVNGRIPALNGLWGAAHSGISLLVITALFAIIFRVLPDVRIAWRDVWIGAVLTAGLFVVGNYLLGFYFGKSAVASSYGTAGSLIIVLVWVFYSAQIFFFGAEFTRAYALRYGSHRLGTGFRKPRLAPRA